jgi:hypothetical protein
MTDDDKDEAAEIAQLIHSVCYDTYVRIPQACLRLVEHYVPNEALLLQKLRLLVKPEKAEVTAVQIACCLNTILPTQDPGEPLDFESYFTTTPEEFLQGTKEPAAPPSNDILAASSIPVNDEVVLELEELLDSC